MAARLGESCLQLIKLSNVYAVETFRMTESDAAF